MCGLQLHQHQHSNVRLIQVMEYVRLGSTNPQCVDDFYRFECSQMYGKCTTTSTGTTEWLPACQSTCAQVVATCTADLAATGYKPLIPNCSQPSPIYDEAPAGDESSTAAGSTLTLPAGYILPSCPAPFLKDPLAQAGTNNSISSDTCANGCCIPCPVQEYFYPVGWMEKGFIATDIIRSVSAILSLFLVISYAVLPDKRTHPSLLIFEFFIALFLYSADVLFVLGNPKRIQCSTDIVASTQDNNLVCAIQAIDMISTGGILIYSTLAMALWVSAVIINLHLHTVWNSKFLVNKYLALNIICWGGPLVVTIISLVYHQVQFEFANLCLLSADWIYKLFFDPLAAIVLPSVVIHLATFFHIARVSMKGTTDIEMSDSRTFGTTSQHSRQPLVSHRRHVVTAFKIQWRALLLALNAMVAFLFYWIFYLVQLPKLANLRDNKEMLASWVQCMMINHDQNLCSSIVSDKLPPFALLITAEALVSLIGVIVFITFAKRSLWREWNDWIYETRMRFKRDTRRYSKDQDQFFAL
ncbi:hypothetical protein NQZ79_g8425 [Umbelopsis isabellina]|nr:hypothetical protein NQZ79_g8425 [Umbelopsis isabellina]